MASRPRPRFVFRPLRALIFASVVLLIVAVTAGAFGCSVGRLWPLASTGLPVPGDNGPGAISVSDGGSSTTTPPTPRQKPAPVLVRGLYMTARTAGSDEKFKALVDYIKSSGLNAAVIDVKDDDGVISFQTDIPLAKEIGSNSDRVRDIKERLAFLKQNHIYAIGRIVVFCDPLLSGKRPDLAVAGGKFHDRRGLSWTDPRNHDVWQYNIDIAKAAAAAGFDEIQFDYVRFPEKRIPGVTEGTTGEQRVGAISGFLQEARRQLSPYGVYMSADVFGLTTTTSDDMHIGQDYLTVASSVDYISPMVYPSHFAKGNYGLPDPEKDPGETILRSMAAGQKKLSALAPEVQRPWIQDFSLRVPYHKAEVEAQIKALASLGIRQFMLWDPNNHYTRDVDYSLIDAKTQPSSGSK